MDFPSLELIGFETETFAIIIKIIFVLSLTWLSARVMRNFLVRSLQRHFKKVSIDETQFAVFRRLIIMLIYLLGFAVAGSMIPGLSTLGVSILASAGVLAVVLGFAAQAAFSNVISGIFIAIFEPFKVGDKISVKDDYGTVEDITLRHTVVKTWEEKRIVIPNSKISEENIVNYSLKDPRMLAYLDIGISYDSDIDKARKIMVEEAFKHPDLLHEVLGDDNEFLGKKELVKVRLIELTDFSQKMRLYFWAPDKSTSIKMRFDLTEAIKKRFDREGIEVPFPYRTLVYKKDIDKHKKA